MSSRIHPSERVDAAASSSSPASSSPDLDEDDKKGHFGTGGEKSDTSSLYDVSAAGPLAPAGEKPRSAGREILEAVGIYKKSKPFDLDAVKFSHSLSSLLLWSVLTIVVYR